MKLKTPDKNDDQLCKKCKKLESKYSNVEIYSCEKFCQEPEEKNE
jgi:ribosomal protein L37AE/L43A